ncbi:RNA-binding protein 15 [Merluccius polli]|uniref:RNA-binding protein 15 n=1 Tax=Merluccius polli TaxID=89951 RepID=A0AA47MCP9_MERPO|nr:RNA-binding protein 15 [Merluccius polli]
MKGKERSPLKKRSRIIDDIRERGGHLAKKLGPPSGTSGGGGGSNGSAANSGVSARRTLPNDKGDMRDADGHNSNSSSSAGRTGASHHDYGNASSSNKVHGSSSGGGGGGVDLAAAAAAAASSAAAPRTNSRGDTRTASSEGEYKTLKISELGSQLNDEEIEDGLFHEFKKFGDVSVKISRAGDQRVAFVNFRRPDDAKAAKHARGKLVLYDRPLKIDPVFMNRRRSRSPVASFPPGGGGGGHRGNVHPQRAMSPAGLGYRDYRLQQLALGHLPSPHAPPLPHAHAQAHAQQQPPPPIHLRDLERDREFSIFESRNPRPQFIPECAPFREEDLMAPEDVQRANRTLFLGNLDITVTDHDLRRAFDRFGVITEVDIKRAVRGQNSTYGFLKFENLDMAHRAKVAMSGKVVGRNPIKVGYGKATPTTRLWVGGLGPWVPVAALAREFDRFGTIRTIDYRKGDPWAYIQYESLDAAQAACTHMRGFPLGGPDRRLRVDFAETEQRYLQQYMQHLPLPPYDLVPEAFEHRPLPESLRVRERSPPPSSISLRFRERDLYPGNEWAGLDLHDRARGPGFEPIDHLILERRARETWSLERERELRDAGRKRRPLDDGRRPDRSPNGGDFVRRRRGNSLERSPGGMGRYNDNERAPHAGRLSPAREHQSSLDPTGPSEKRRRTLSPTAPGASSDRDRKRKAGDLCRSPIRRGDPSHPPFLSGNSSSSKSSAPPSKQGAGSQKLSQAWQGVLLLKNSSFPTSVHLLQGDMAVPASLLVEGSKGGPVSQLKISQRLRLDQPKLDEVNRRIKASGPAGHAVLLAVPGKTEDGRQDSSNSSTERPLKNLVSYLKQKEAAGVISLPVGGSRDKEHTGVLHAFPPCQFSERFLDASSKAFAKSEDEYLLMIVIRGAS